MRNAVERAVILNAGPRIEEVHLSNLAAGAEPKLKVEVGAAVTLAELTDEHIRRVLTNTARLEDAAEILGIDLATLYRRRRKWQSEESDHRNAG